MNERLWMIVIGLLSSSLPMEKIKSSNFYSYFYHITSVNSCQ
jgi:hypothetical protein